MKTTRRNDRLVVIPETDIVSSMAGTFRQELLALIEEGGGDLEIDLSGVQMIDSVGLGVFIALHNSLEKREKRLFVANAADHLHALFTTMGLHRRFSVTKKPAQAG